LKSVSRWGRCVTSTALPKARPRSSRSQFDRLMARVHDASAYAYPVRSAAIDDRDVRSELLEQRKAALAKLLRKAKPGIRLSEHLTGPGQTIFEHACKLVLEGIVSKRLSSPYRSGKAKFWIKVKNPNAPAMLRIVEGGG